MYSTNWPCRSNCRVDPSINGPSSIKCSSINRPEPFRSTYNPAACLFECYFSSITNRKRIKYPDVKRENSRQTRYIVYFACIRNIPVRSSGLIRIENIVRTFRRTFSCTVFLRFFFFRTYVRFSMSLFHMLHVREGISLFKRDRPKTKGRNFIAVMIRRCTRRRARDAIVYM